MANSDKPSPKGPGAQVATSVLATGELAEDDRPEVDAQKADEADEGDAKKALKTLPRVMSFGVSLKNKKG